MVSAGEFSPCIYNVMYIVSAENAHASYILACAISGVRELETMSWNRGAGAESWISIY